MPRKGKCISRAANSGSLQRHQGSKQSKTRHRSETIHPLGEGLGVARKVSRQTERPQREEQPFGAQKNKSSFSRFGSPVSCFDCSNWNHPGVRFQCTAMNMRSEKASRGIALVRRLQEAVQTPFARQRIRKAWRIFKTKGGAPFVVVGRLVPVVPAPSGIDHEPTKHGFLVFCRAMRSLGPREDQG